MKAKPNWKLSTIQNRAVAKCVKAFEHNCGFSNVIGDIDKQAQQATNAGEKVKFFPFSFFLKSMSAGRKPD